jgi:G3E family GTPase
MSQAIALTVLGGFLGAGKTTVLNHLLQAPHGLRLMVLVNDFGAVNIDASLIQSVSGDGVISLRNGCVCCSMGGELMNALMAIEKQAANLDGLIIEGSGVSDPKKIAQIGALGQGFALQSIITIVDAAAVLEQCEDRHTGDMVKTQIAAAHMILLNKIDLVDEARRKQVLAWLHETAPGVPVFAGSNGQFDWTLLLSRKGQHAFPSQSQSPSAGGVDTGLFAGRQATAPAAYSFESYSFDNAGAFDEQRLRAAFSQMPAPVLRAKGIVLLGSEKKSCVLHYVRGQRVSLEPAMSTIAAGPLVFVGTTELDKVALQDALRQAVLA